MRTTQYIGLTDGCKSQIETLKKRSIQGWETFGMFDENIPLYSYHRQDGSCAAIEYVIACPWSSGPMIFVGLMTPHGPSEYNWKEGDESVREYDSQKGLYYV